jgi:hypothetical protein
MTPVPRFVPGRDLCHQILTARPNPTVMAQLEPIEPPAVIHVGLPIRCAGTIEVGNHIHVDRDTFVVVRVGGAAFDMVRVDPP